MKQSTNRSSSARALAKPSAAPSFGGWLTRTLQQTATLALAIFGFLFCLLSSYSLTADVAKLTLSATIFVLLFSASYSSKRRGILALAVFLLGLIWGWIHVNELLQGILLLVQQAISPLSLNLPESMQALLTAHDAAETLPVVVHTFSHYRLYLQPLRLRKVALRERVRDNDGPVSSTGQALRWVARGELATLGLPAPIRKLLGN